MSKLLCVLGVGLCCAGIMAADPATKFVVDDAAMARNILKLDVSREAATASNSTAVSRACGGYAVYLNDDAGGWYVHGTTENLDIADDIQVAKPGGATINCVQVSAYGVADTANYDFTIEFWDACPLTAGANMLWTYTWANNVPAGFVDLETTLNVTVPETFWCRYMTTTLDSGVHIAMEAELGFTDNVIGEPTDPPDNYNCNVWFGPELYSGLDLDLYTNEEPVGACCFDSQTPPVCYDGYDELSCTGLGGRWAAYVLCADLDPPCGQAGACCHEDYTCDITGEADCLAPSVWLGPGTTCDQCPACVVECPMGAQAEVEPCGNSANNGCGADPEAFEDTACGATICGTAWADGGARDEDWWKIIITERSTVTFVVEAEFPLFMGFCVFEPEGSADCADFTGYIGPYVTTEEVCAPQTVEKICNPGTYYLRVAPWVTDGMPCGTGPGTDGEWTYAGEVLCTAAPLPPCTPDPLYENQPDLENFTSGWPSQDFLDGDHLAMADDFIITGRETVYVGRVDWAGFYNGDGYIPLGWEIHFYADNGLGTEPVGDGQADPRPMALAGFVIPNAEVTTVNLGGNSFYYQAELPADVELETGVKYWISILVDMVWEDPYVQWYWACNTTLVGATVVQGVSFNPESPYWTPKNTYSLYFCLMPGEGEEPCPTELGDVNGDGTANNFDISPFVYAVTHTQTEFESAYPDGHYFCADCSEDGTVNNFDISPFVYVITH